MTAPLLHLRDVRFRHPGAAAPTLDGVSLELGAGEVLGLVGPNAAGKSTLARIAAGLLRPDGGEVSLDGRPLHALARKDRAVALAFLAQQTPIELPFSARAVALMGRAPHLGLLSLETPKDRALVDGALRAMDVLDLGDRPIAQLSGGERQRVHLARVLAQEARVLILDEPTTALDLAHQVLLADAIARRTRAGCTALLVLHDLSLAAAACDRLALLVQGRIVAQGPPGEVLREGSLASAYGTPVDVVLDPATGKPLVAPRIRSGRR